MTMAKDKDFRDFAIYFSLAILIVLFVYYLPDYYFLEVAVAGHSSAVLSIVGVEAPVHFAEVLLLWAIMQSLESVLGFR